MVRIAQFHPFAGYYADPEAQCQVFHICTADGQGGDEIATLDGVFHDLRLWGLPKAHKGFLTAA